MAFSRNRNYTARQIADEKAERAASPTEAVRCDIAFVFACALAPAESINSAMKPQTAPCQRGKKNLDMMLS